MTGEELRRLSDESDRTLAASYIRRYPIRAELWSWLETTTEAVLVLFNVVLWGALAVLTINHA
jgi:hypothetical protein